jgi:alpha-glucoside transport system substrate-binding protein
VVAGVVLAGGLSAALLGDRQAAVEQDAIASARELAAGSVANLGQSRQLSVLLALEAADATASRGYVVEEAYDALQWALQDAQVPSPAGKLPVGVRQAPDGPRGIFLVAPDVLMQSGIEYIRGVRPSGTLAADECRTYRHAESCPPVEPPNGVSLGVRTGAGVMPAASLAVGAVPGTHVRVLSELPADVSPLVVAFERESGVAVDWDPALGGDLEARIAARDLPDVAIVSRPSYVAAAARDGWLLDLGALVDTASLAADAGAYAMGLGTSTGPAPSGGATGQYGAPLAASVDDLLWYPGEAFATAGYRPPSTPDELADLVAKLRRDGRTPWCLGNEAGSSTGSAAAAWVEDLFLDAQGPASYDRWTDGETAFDTPEVRAAVEAFGGFVMGDGDIAEGLRSVNLISDRIAWLPMLAFDAPRCWLYRGASTDRAAFARQGLADRAAAVPYPAGSPGAHPVLGRLYMVVVVHDRPEVRRLVESLLGSPFASAMASGLAGDGIFTIRRSALPAGGIAAEAERLRTGLDLGTFRVRAVDLLPGRVAAGFMGDLTAYLQVGVQSTAMRGFSADEEWAAIRAGGSP